MGYPLPCNGCNMIAQDENIAYECFERDGWLKNGEMVIHFPDCPFGPKVEYNWLSGKITHVPKELVKVASGLFVHKSVVELPAAVSLERRHRIFWVLAVIGVLLILACFACGITFLVQILRGRGTQLAVGRTIRNFFSS